MGQTVTESFTGSSAPGWVLGGNSYTPVLTSGGLDPVDDGWLRLTDNANNRATYAYYDTAVSSANRTVFTSFDYASYNGTGADGITFFLFDGAVEFSEGAFGGSMGYAPKTTAAGGEVDKEGLAGGYLAVSLDDFGNFSNATEGRTGGIGSNPNAVAVRGPGSGYDGYEFIAATGDGTNAALTQQLDFPTSTARPDQTGVDYRHVEILLTPTNQLTVWLQFGVDGALTKVLEADLSGYLRPETLKFGFTSGTGGQTEIHELRALTVATLVANLWDNGANGGDSTPGDWGTSANWNPDVPVTGDDILFDNTFVSSDQTVNVGAATTRVIRSIQIDAPFSYTLNNGTLEFDDAGTPGYVGISVTQTNGVASAGNTINSAIRLQTNAGVRNATTSTLTLGGAIDTNGKTLTVDGAGNTTATGVISGSGMLVKEQAGNLTLSGANTYSGGTTVSGGTITAGHNTALGSGGVTMTGGTLAGSGSPTIGNAVSLQGDAGFSNITVSGAVSQTGGNRTLTLDGATISGGVVLAENNQARTLTANVTADSTISGVIANGGGTGADGLTKTGAATLTLSGNNTYTGTTTINEGAIKLGSSDRLSNNSNLDLAGGTLDLAGYSERINNLTVTAASNLDFGPAATSNYFVFNDLTATPSGVLSIYNWEQASDIIASAQTLSAAELSMFYFVGFGSGATHSDTQAVGAYGSGWNPINPNTSGWYTWDSGNSSDRWDRGANWDPNLSNGWTSGTSTKVAFGTGAYTTVDLRGNRTINAMRFDAGSASFNIGNNQGDILTFSGPTASSVAFIQQNSSNNQSLTMGTVWLARNTVVDMGGAGDLTITSALIGSGNLVKENTGGKLILSGNSTTYGGGVFINSGVVQITSANALGNTTGTTTISEGATLELNGDTFTSNENISLRGEGVGGTGAIRGIAGTTTLSGTLTLAADARINADSGNALTLGGTVTGAGKNLTLGGAGTTTISGTITTGAGAVTKDGTGTLTYTGAGANTYTGATTVNAGTLVLNKNAGVNALAGNLVIGDGTGTDTVRLGTNHQIADAATVTINNGGVFDLNGKLETIGGLNSASSGSLVQLASGGTLTVVNSSANSFAGTFTGSGDLTKSGVGRLTLSGASGSYSGTVNVNAGIVAVQTGTALGTGTVNVASGGNIEVQNNVTMANVFSIAGNGSGASDGAIENFSGNNTLTGNISLADNARIGSSSGTLTLSSAGTLTGANRNLMISGAGNTVINRNINTGTGTLTKEGSGNLTLNVANSYTGATAITAGKITAGTTGIFSDAASLTVHTGAVYDMAGFSETIGSLQGGGAGEGGSINFGGATLTLASGASDFGGDFGFSNGTIILNAGASLTLTDSFNATNINIILNGGTLYLGDGLTHTFGDLTVTGVGNSVIDFGTSGATIAEFTSVDVTGAGDLSVNNWTDYIDYFIAGTSPGPQGSSPTNKVVFSGFVGNDTKWAPLVGGNGQLTPVPEPSTYGAIFLGSAAGLFWLRRRRRAGKRTP